MPHVSYKSLIDAAYQDVTALLVDKMEHPKKYVGVILHSTILERGDGFLLREMYQPPPVDLTIKEKIYQRDLPDGQEFIYEYVDNAAYTGAFRNLVKRVPGRDDQAELEYVMAWDPHPGTADKLTDNQAKLVVRNGVEHLKHLAENPPQVPDWVRRFYVVVDSMGSEPMAPLFAEDARFRMGNNPVVIGRDAVVAGSHQVTKMFAAIQHDYVSVDEVNGKTFVDSWVTYTMFDKTTFTLPFLTVFENRDDEITDIKIYGDISPLRHGWPA